MLIILFVPSTCNRKDTGIAWSRGCRLRCKSRGRKAIGRTLEPVPKQNCPEAKKSFVIFQIHLQPSSQLSEDLAKTGLSADGCLVEPVIELVQGIFKPFSHILFESLVFSLYKSTGSIFIYPVTLKKFSYPEKKQSAVDTEPHVSLMTQDEVEASKCSGSTISMFKTP